MGPSSLLHTGIGGHTYRICRAIRPAAARSALYLHCEQLEAQLRAFASPACSAAEPLQPCGDPAGQKVGAVALPPQHKPGTAQKSYTAAPSQTPAPRNAPYRRARPPPPPHSAPRAAPLPLRCGGPALRAVGRPRQARHVLLESGVEGGPLRRHGRRRLGGGPGAARA